VNHLFEAFHKPGDHFIQLMNAVLHRIGRITGRGQAFVDGQFPGPVIEQNKIGKRAADIAAQPVNLLRHGCLLNSC